VRRNDLHELWDQETPAGLLELAHLVERQREKRVDLVGRQAERVVGLGFAERIGQFHGAAELLGDRLEVLALTGFLQRLLCGAFQLLFGPGAAQIARNDRAVKIEIASVGALDDVETELGFDHLGDLALAQRKGCVFELLDHAVAGEEAQVAAAFCRSLVFGVLLRQLGEIRPGAQGQLPYGGGLLPQQLHLGRSGVLRHLEQDVRGSHHLLVPLRAVGLVIGPYFRVRDRSRQRRSQLVGVQDQQLELARFVDFVIVLV